MSKIERNTTQSHIEMVGPHHKRSRPYLENDIGEMEPGEFIEDNSLSAKAPRLGSPSRDIDGNEYNDPFGYYAEGTGFSF